MSNNKVVKTPVQRVLEKIVYLPWSGCWIFTGAVNEAGYGIVGMGKRGSPTDRAHRVLYRHFKKEIPDGMFVCHACDVRCCVNPDHLFIGTNQDNVDDMVKKGRNSRPPRNPHIVGDAHPLAKFSNEQVKQIRIQHKNGLTIYRLAKDYGVANSTMQRIIHGERYKNV